MNQSLTVIGLAAKTDFHAQLGELVYGWNPDYLGLAFSDWTSDFQEPLSPELRDLTALFSELTVRLTADLIPADLIEKPIELHTGTSAGKPGFTGKTIVAASQVPQKTVKNALSTQAATATNFAASEKPVQAKNGTVPGIFSGTPAVPPPPLNDSRMGQNTPDREPGFTLPDHELGQQSRKQIDLSNHDTPDAIEFHTLGKLSDMGNYRQVEASTTGQPGETGSVWVQPNTTDSENLTEISFQLSGGKPWYRVESLLPLALNARKQPTAPTSTSAAPDGKLKPETPAELDPDAWYAELARKLQDEYERFYDD